MFVVVCVCSLFVVRGLLFAVCCCVAVLLCRCIDVLLSWCVKLLYGVFVVCCVLWFMGCALCSVFCDLSFVFVCVVVRCLRSVACWLLFVVRC